MKTVVQEIISDFESGEFFKLTIMQIKHKLKEFEQKEKDQIKRAYNFGDADAYSTNTDDWAEQYYNETFGPLTQNEKTQP